MQNVACARTLLKICIRTNVFLNAIKTAGGNNTAIICDGKQVKQGFPEILNKIKALCTTDNMFFCLILIDQ